MPVNLPQPVATFVQAVGAQDPHSLVTAFTEDGVVQDSDGSTFRGHREILGWSIHHMRTQPLDAQVTASHQVDQRTLLVALAVDGLAGGPRDLHLHFTLSGQHIALLTVLA
ncbi:hypothetical protein GCM10010174_18910 [Kutzneria viridogrisea]|uniref:SnoaL-like domain-containing protein n=2 Tax=Kutzneria TaxID=43356 RepID=W5WEB9_9PSEU|nr:hypothetical protein [Kutzneria albida]AHH99533.1 hypothetical protein KALB_6173 [Kutzneria albida DSM 43870]MBA8922911.1 ketosteroid isomerase-like protein [Kutzneria viridogrisea]